MKNASYTFATRASLIAFSAVLIVALAGCGQRPETLVVGAPTDCVAEPPVPTLTPGEYVAAFRYNSEHKNDPNNRSAFLAPPQSVIPADDPCSQPAPVDTTPEPPDSLDSLPGIDSPIRVGEDCTRNSDGCPSMTIALPTTTRVTANDDLSEITRLPE
jgi:hypothetical protein